MSEKVTKNDLVESIYESSDIDRKVIANVIDELLYQLKGQMEKGNTIELRGFGTFEARLRKGRKVARNPRTGETLTVAPHYVAAFRAGQELKNNLLKLTPQKKD